MKPKPFMRVEEYRIEAEHDEFMFEDLFAEEDRMNRLNAWLLAYYRRHSNIIEGDESYNDTWVFVILRAIDIWAATIIWRKYGITISSWTGLEMRNAAPQWWAIWLGAFLVRLQENHCEGAIVADRERLVNAAAALSVKVL